MTQSSPDTTVRDERVAAPRFGGLFRSLAINVGVPFIAIQVLLNRGVSPVVALVLVAAVPFTVAVVEIARTRRADPLAVLALIAIVVGVATTGLTGNPAFALAKDSLFTGVTGIVFLASLFGRRPIIFSLGRQFTVGNDPAAQAAWEARWSNAGFRRVMRLMTAVWGGGLLLEAVLRVIAAFTLPAATASILSTVLQVVTVGGLIVWTSVYARIIRRRVAAAMAAAAVPR
jgi:hypothetical protein